ncbi:MAG: motif putative anchor domain protein [Rhodocyclaceae bacterium]|nr:motif putative anchor domain protein [Rhodocyclaceae bacterium]
MKAKNRLIACAGAALLWAGHAGAAVLLSDNFNSETQGLNYTGFTNWNVTAGSVDLIGTGFFDFYPGNGNYVDLAGSTGFGGTLTSKQSFAVASGGSFDLSFDLGGSARGPTNIVDVILAGTTLATLTLASSAPLALHTYSLHNNSGSALSGNLVFRNETNGTQGAILDNVILSSNSATVSEPATTLLLGLGLAGLILGRRRLTR